MNNYETKGNRLICRDGTGSKSISFHYPVDEVIEFANCYVVSIEPPIKEIFNENIFGVSKQGEMLWQLEEIPHAYENSPYTGMEKDGDTAKLCNWDGTDLWIDPLSGKIIKKGFSK